MPVNYPSSLHFCLCVTYAGAAAPQWVDQKTPTMTQTPAPIMKQEPLHLPAAMDWLDNALVYGAVDLFS